MSDAIKFMWRQRTPLVLCVGLFVISMSASAMQWSGYAKTFGVHTQIGEDPLQQWQTAARIMADSSLSEHLDWQVHYELLAVLSSERNQLLNGALDANQNSEYRWRDLNREVNGSALDEQTRLYQNLDRAYLHWALAEGDLTLGRQAITFGSSRFVSPADVLLPLGLGALNEEYRQGVDGVRYQHNWSALHQWDMGVIHHDDQPLVYVRGLQALEQANLEWLVTQLPNGELVSLGLQGAIGQAGAWAEYAYAAEGGDYHKATFGVDYSLREDLFVQSEWHFNGAANWLEKTGQAATGVYLLSEHYWMASLQWQATPLISHGLSVYQNLDQRSGFWRSQTDVSWADDIISQLGVYGGSGARDSEFSHESWVVYVSLNGYF